MGNGPCGLSFADCYGLVVCFLYSHCSLGAHLQAWGRTDDNRGHGHGVSFRLSLGKIGRQSQVGVWRYRIQEKASWKE